MRLFSIFLLSLLALSAQQGDEAAPIVPADGEERLIPLINQDLIPARQQTTSDITGKIIVRGATPPIRSQILTIATQQREALYDLLELEKDGQKHPIIIQLFGKAGDRAPRRLINKSFKLVADRITFNIDLHLAVGVREDLLEEAIVQLLLMEISARNHTFSPDDELVLKIQPWLTKGVREAIRWKTDKSDRALYARLFEQQSIYSLEELLKETSSQQLTEVMDVAFNISSGALIMALLKQPSGVPGLLNLIKESSTFEGEQRILLTKNFPESTLSKNSLAKWWALQLASMAENPAEDLLTIALTEAQLQEAALIKTKDKEGNSVEIGPEQYLDIDQLPQLRVRHALINTFNRLGMLKTRAFPSYRPIITGYQKILYTHLSDGENEAAELEAFGAGSEEIDIEVAITSLADERRIISALGERTTDYLNWFQLEQPVQQSHQFDGFLRVKQSLDLRDGASRGHISQYLDDIQKLYEK